MVAVTVNRAQQAVTLSHGLHSLPPHGILVSHLVSSPRGVQ